MLLQIARHMDDKMGPGEVELLAAVSATAEEDEEEQPKEMSESEAEHVAEMVESAKSDGVTTVREEAAIKDAIMDVVTTKEKAQVAVTVLQELAQETQVDSEAVAETIEAVEAVADGQVNAEDVKILADMTAKLSNEVSFNSRQANASSSKYTQ